MLYFCWCHNVFIEYLVLGDHYVVDIVQKRMYAEMVDKEQQISESNQMYGQLQQQLEVMLDTIARETDDIKKLEQQLNDGRL